VEAAFEPEDLLRVVVLGGIAPLRNGDRSPGHLFEQPCDRRFGVRHHADFRRVDLVDLPRFEVDVDQLLPGEQVVAKVEGRVLGERVAHGQHDVRGEEDVRCALMAAVREDADGELVLLRNDALAVHGRDQW
jgi:hypothetical protein